MTTILAEERAISATIAQAPAKTRVEWIDFAKGIFVLLVVLGHVIRGLINAGLLDADHPLTFLDVWVNAHHVPVFFFLAGIFALRSAKRSVGQFLSDKFRAIVYPYVLWSLIMLTAMSLLGSVTNLGAVALTPVTVGRYLLFDPFMHLWFLYALFFNYLLLLVAIKLGLGKLGYVTIAAAFFALGMLLPLDPTQILFRTMFQTIFFALGAVFGEAICRRLAALKLPVLAVISVAAFALLTLLLMVGIGRDVLDYLARFGLALLGLLGALALSIVLNQTLPGRLVRIVRVWGQKSMQIYIAHVLAASGLRVVLVRVFGLTDPWLHVALQTAAGVVVPLWLDAFLGYIRFPYAFSLRPPHTPMRNEPA
jgi:fucose 4-O-acetylase-like acetyltransferase